MLQDLVLMFAHSSKQRRLEKQARKAAAQPFFLSVLKTKKSMSSTFTEETKSISSESSTPIETEAKRQVPTSAELEVAMGLPILDSHGQSVEFGSIMQARGKTVVIFVRHWWCGLCVQYMEQLASIPKSRYTSRRIKLVIVGCGSPELIEPYKSEPTCILTWRSGADLVFVEMSNLDVLMYTDPTGRLHSALKLNKSLAPGKDKDKGDYIKKSMTKNSGSYS